MPYGYGSANKGSGASHDRGGSQHQATAARQVAAARPRDHHPGESTGREQAIASRTYARPGTVTYKTGPHRGDGIGSQTFNKNLRTLARQQQYRQGAYQRAHPFLSKLRGGIGGVLRGALGFFGGIPGRVASGIMTASDYAKRKGSGVLQGIGEFGETDEFGNPLYPTWDRYINRNTGKYDDKPYMGQGNRNFTFDDQVATNVTNPNLNNVGDNVGGTNLNDYQGVNFNTQPNNEIFTDQNLMAKQLSFPFDYANTGDPYSSNLYPPRAVGAEGGRIGYQGGELVEDESMMEATPAGMMEENIEEVQGEPSREQLEAIAFEIFRLPLEELDEQQLMVVYQAAMEQEPSEEEVQFAAQEGPPEGIASLV